MLDISSLRAECRRIRVVRSVRGGSKEPGTCRGVGSYSQGLDSTPQRMSRILIFGGPSAKRRVWTMSTLSTSDWPVLPPDWPGFRMFPPLPSVY